MLLDFDSHKKDDGHYSPLAKYTMMKSASNNFDSLYRDKIESGSSPTMPEIKLLLLFSTKMKKKLNICNNRYNVTPII